MNTENKTKEIKSNDIGSTTQNQSIHDFQFELICEYFSYLERQGPGSIESTLRALSFIENLTDKSLIADIGCGTGGQTITLAKNTQAKITAVDLFPKFVDLLKANAEKEGINDRINAIVGDMTDLPFNESPKEIHDFWMDAYPEIDVISAKIAQMEQAGYKTVAHFTLPGSCWLDGYYASQKNSRDLFLRKYGEHQVAVDFVAIMQHEEAMYNKYKEFYGYAFYIGKKI